MTSSSDPRAAGQSGDRPIAAFLFDMDGTLVDSEGRTADAVEALLTHHGLAGSSLAPTAFHGRTWRAVADDLLSAFPQLEPAGLDRKLLAHFDDSIRRNPPPPIEGAVGALLAALEAAPTAVVSASNASSIRIVVQQLGVPSDKLATVAAEDVARSKPDPECFLLAAQRLSVRPGRCLVFEDSVAGLRAARRAGMRVVAVAGERVDDEREALRRLADYVINTFGGLAPEFFVNATQGSSEEVFRELLGPHDTAIEG